MGDMLVASDPEMFLRVKGTEQYVSAIGLLGGDKDNPRKVPHGTVQEDNIMAEVAPLPASTAKEFVTNTVAVLNDLQSILDEYGLEYVIRASITATDDMLADPLSLIAGCDMDYDAWAMRENIAPDVAGTNLRSAGGHLHLSHPIFENPAASTIAARLYDKYVGVPSVLLDEDTQRALLYGTAGRYRRTKYPNGNRGVEYRTVSNWWIAKTEYMEWAFRQSQRVLEDTIRIITTKAFDEIENTRWATVINTHDMSRAALIVDQAKIELPI